MTLSILQWNARSIIANGQELKNFIEELEVKPNIICIQETWLKPTLDFIIYGYTVVRKDRDTTGGGVATFIQQGINYRNIELNVLVDVEVVLVDIWIGRTKIKIINFYNPCKKIVREMLDGMYEGENGKVILCGDFNAHNTLWGGTKVDENGSTIEEFMDDNKLICLNDGRCTRFDAYHGTESALDLTIVSDQIAGVSQWEVKESFLGSDHYVIWLSVGNQKLCLEDNWFSRWKMREANWGLYSYKVNGKMMEIISDRSCDVDELNSKITNVLCEAAEEVIGKSSGMRKRKMVPWWSDECKEAVKFRNKAFRNVKSNHSYTNLIEFKRAQAKVKQVVREAKRKYWCEFCGKIGAEVKVGDVWSMIRKMGGMRREFSIPVIKNNEVEAVTNQEKAEMLAKGFVKVHSSKNLTDGEVSWRVKVMEENKGLLGKKVDSESVLDNEFTLFELKRALNGVKNTSPGKDGICYKMIKEIDDVAKCVILKLYNKIWEQGKLPLCWKHSVVVPIGKPGKNRTEVKSYRPIALTSNLCKLMERMVVRRLMYEVEKKDLLSKHQSGFRSGRTTMDPVVCLENLIRKAQNNKEVVLATFFDIEKAYDMLWKEGLLIKLNRMNIGGKMFNWIRDFLKDRTIEVRVGVNVSKTYSIENGTPQGSVCSPVFFNLMINDIFESIEDMRINRALYADDGALWVRGRNIENITAKMQLAINKVEKWAFEWGFHLSVEKTQVICFSKKRNNPNVELKLYGQLLKQVNTIRYLGVWLDVKLTFKEHIQKMLEKCKKGNNVLKCLTGYKWGASGTSLKRIYIALIRSVFDYGCIVYQSASKTQIKELDRMQAKSLRICSGAFRTSPVPALQVETEEMPLNLRRLKLCMAYWINLKGHNASHPTKEVLSECWEYGRSQICSFGWDANRLANQLKIEDIHCSKTLPLAITPPWLFCSPRVIIETKDMVGQYIENMCYNTAKIYTDASKDSEGKTGIGVYIPESEIYIKKRTTDHLSIYTAEMVAIIIALQWLEEARLPKSVICTDSMSSLTSNQNGESGCRQDLLNEINQIMFTINQQGTIVQFVWVPAHKGIEGNEQADKLAKEATKEEEIQINVLLSKSEIKVIIKQKVNAMWQSEWDQERRGRHLYKLQQEISRKRTSYTNRQEEVWFNRLRIGHTGLNSNLFIIKKHPSGNCEVCGEREDVEHVLLRCRRFNREREILKRAVNTAKKVFSLETLLAEPRSGSINSSIVAFIKDTQLACRI
uniref:Reverse transcriptase domain-containing protein n=1 Tax=Cyprinus carpio TaxID=7962 RepID=A0A8C2BUC3_CYPCA